MSNMNTREEQSVLSESMSEEEVPGTLAPEARATAPPVQNHAQIEVRPKRRLPTRLCGPSLPRWQEKKKTTKLLPKDMLASSLCNKFQIFGRVSLYANSVS